VVIFQSAERRMCLPATDVSLSDFRSTFGDLLLDDPEAVRAQVTSRSRLRADDLPGALAANDEVLALVPPNASLLLHRSRLLAGLGDPAAALDALHSAFTFDPRDTRVGHALAQCLREQGRYAEAAAAAQWATLVDPDQVDLWSFAISTALEADDATSACALARSALDHHGDLPLLHFLHSQALVAASDLEAAETSVRRALSARPDDVFYLRQLASVQIRTQQWTAARDSLALLRSLEPDATDLDAFVELVEQQLAAVGAP